MIWCDLPPDGWACFKEKGHAGPCPTWPSSEIKLGSEGKNLMSAQNRIVHYVLMNGECRPFLVTRAWSDTTVNGTLFIDGSNDYSSVPNFTPNVDSPQVQLLVWKTSVGLLDGGKASNTWHWPEKD